MPGFRKGYAPLDVVRLRFKDEIRSEVLQEVVPEVVSDAIKEHDLHPLSEPHIHLDDQENVSVSGSKPLVAACSCRGDAGDPRSQIRGIEVIRRVKPVEDGSVEDLIADACRKRPH